MELASVDAATFDFWMWSRELRTSTVSESERKNPLTNI